MATIETTPESIGLVKESGLPHIFRNWIKLLPVSNAIHQVIIKQAARTQNQMHGLNVEEREILEAKTMQKELLMVAILVPSIFPLGILQLPFGVIHEGLKKIRDTIDHTDIEIQS